MQDKKIRTTKPPRIFLDASVSEFGVVGIGIYESQSKEKTAITLQTTTPLTSNEAEELAFKKAIAFASTKFKSKVFYFFTDSQYVYKKYREIMESYNKENLQLMINWIPRELNGEADKLSKLASSRGRVEGSHAVEVAIEQEVGTIITTSICDFIRGKTLKQRYTLLRKIFHNENEKSAINYLFHKIGSKPNTTKAKIVLLKNLARYIQSTYSATEKKKLNGVKEFLVPFREGPGNQVAGLKNKQIEKLIRTRVKTAVKEL